MSIDALIKQRRDGKSFRDLGVVVDLAARFPGYTASQLSWLASGGQVNESGHCVPAAEYDRVVAYHNYKRRISESAFDAEVLSEHPKAKFQYGNAVNNPYQNGGQGIYPVGFSDDPVVPASVAVVESGSEQEPVSLDFDGLIDGL